jgi:uncharacterized membrane protein YfcA
MIHDASRHGFQEPMLRPIVRRLRRLPWGAGAPLLGMALLLAWQRTAAGAPEGAAGLAPWWVWPLGLFLLTSVLGVVTVLAGIGGAVVFVPLVGGFAPGLHLDFIRGAGLTMALAGTLAAVPALLRARLIELRLGIPLALAASLGAIFGAQWGLALPAPVLQGALGVTILLVAGVMALARAPGTRAARAPDRLARLLRIEGRIRDPAGGAWLAWQPRRMVPGLFLFTGIGAVGGLFGLGAGWANIPALNLVLGVPFKAAVATSSFVLATSTSTAIWVYLKQGALLPIVVVPALLGAMLGATLGARLLLWMPPAAVRGLVIGALVVSGLRSLMKGFGL